jgi:glycosyltransferase involved in cell wall biosynthesis
LGVQVSEDIRFSILTPTWNRAIYLNRVYASLAEQTMQSFEWIVADDGSSDDTESVIKFLGGRSSFPLIYIRADRHVGKVIMDNASVRQAKGQFILWCDSDD